MPEIDTPTTLSQEERDQARRLANVVGITVAATEAGVSRQSFGFALAGLETRRGTVALIRAWLKGRNP